MEICSCRSVSSCFNFRSHISGMCFGRSTVSFPLSKQTYSIAGIPDLQRKGNLEEEGNTSSRVQCQCCNMANVVGTTFCACGAKQENLSKEQEEQARTSLQERFQYIHPFLTQLEIIPPNFRINIFGHSRATQQHGKANDHQKVSKF